MKETGSRGSHLMAKQLTGGGENSEEEEEEELIRKRQSLQSKEN